MVTRAARNSAKRFMLTLHRWGIKCGVHILPVHYYTPVPNILELQKTQHIWAKKSQLPGISVNLDEQADRLRKVCNPYRDEFSNQTMYPEVKSLRLGPGYGHIEAQVLHAVVRHFKPRRIVEVGSGASTYCMLSAVDLNKQEGDAGTTIVSIEPHPSEWLQNMDQIELLSSPVQTVSADEFTKLRNSDLLFIDSSHTVKPGGDVNYLILEVLPRLAPGVIVHFHDIYLPYDYQRDVLRTFLHWAETSLLRAFLINNSRIEIMFCLSHLHYESADVLHEVFPDYRPRPDINGLNVDNHRPFTAVPEHFPSSIYLRCAT